MKKVNDWNHILSAEISFKALLLYNDSQHISEMSGLAKRVF